MSTDELARLGDALVEAETIGLPYTVDETRPTAKHAPKPENRRRKLDPSAVAAIRLLILTGARLREILTARWEYVDFERGLMNLTTSKTGRKSVFLSAAALEVLSALPHAEGNPHIFPGEKAAAPRADLKNPWAEVTLAAKFRGCASMTYAILSLASARAAVLACQSSASSWVIPNPRQRRATLIWMRTRRGEPSIRSGTRSAPR